MQTPRTKFVLVSLKLTMRSVCRVQHAKDDIKDETQDQNKQISVKMVLEVPDFFDEERIKKAVTMILDADFKFCACLYPEDENKLRYVIDNLEVEKVDRVARFIF